MKKPKAKQSAKKPSKPKEKEMNLGMSPKGGMKPRMKGMKY